MVRDILKIFGEVSGLVINFSKCAAYPIRCEGIDAADILQPLSVQQAALPCRYLGMPLSTRKPRKIDLQPLLDKMGSKLAAWKSSFMSSAGRLVLLRSVLSAIPTYTMMTLQLPAWFIKDCDRLRRGWLWAGKPEATGGQCKVSWRAVCRPLELGGLGIPDLTLFGRALRIRWLWYERVWPDKPWVGLPLPCSDIDRELFAVATSVLIADGTPASFWNDSWLGVAPRITMPSLFKLSSRKNRSVADALRNGR